MRVTVDVDDLVPALGDEAGRSAAGNGAGAAAPTSNAAELRLERARSVASSLDLRGARVDEALEALEPLPRRRRRWPGSTRSLIIHGLGTGAVRDAVRVDGREPPAGQVVRPGQRGEGGDGATIVEF